MMDEGKILRFRENEWPAGHAPTNYTRLRSATTPYAIQWAKDFEPYVVLSRSFAPHYDERFVGFGWNKVLSS